MRKITFLIVLSLIFLSSCEDKKHFLKEKAYRQKVHEQFEKRKAEAANRHEALFNVFENEELTIEKREALEFLYAYMPLCDLADYEGEYYLRQINAAFEARDYFSWGKSVPDDIFRHFVLVHRVNNEYLDESRAVFFEELKDRIKDLSMYDAALEVNHWCHEKVTYRATDGRTSSPLALMKTSWGRCGEESTFTAAAMRAVGIPARQVYTPRWVHTDSNHAWVEVWINGKWYYLGACEPEPELNVAWFTGPAKRAMMLHTNVFGLYTGSEEKNLETALYSKINLLENYAPVRAVKVRVLDKNDNPVHNAKIQFKVYNYAEMYPIAEVFTDKDGKASIISGMGDLLVWANNDEYFGFEKSSAKDDEILIKLDKNNDAEELNLTELFVLEAPEEQKITGLSADKIAQNALRLAYEDSIRNAYMQTFASEKYAGKLGEKLNLDKKELWKYLQSAQGNWEEISLFVENQKDNRRLFPFLATLLEKDLRDTPSEFLMDHIKDAENYPPTISIYPENILVEKILSPRIALELIKPWRSFFQQKEIAREIGGENRDVNNIIRYTKENIRIKDEENYYNCYITPQGVYELKMADRRSRNVFFVAVCRSLGIPAHIESATGKPQYYENGKWIDVVFEESDSAAANLPKANIKIIDEGNIIKPLYGVHYTIARFDKGDFNTLSLRNKPAINDYPADLELDEGQYYILQGSRANDGSASISVSSFKLENAKTNMLSLNLPKVEGKLFVKGIIDMNTIVFRENNKKITLKELSNNKGLMLCFIDPGKEPSKHILQDLPAVKDALDEWGGGIVFLTPDDKISTAFDSNAFKNLPKNSDWITDKGRSLLNNALDVLQIDLQDNFPLTIYLNGNGGILYSHVGYKIGVGEEIFKTIQMEKESFKN